MMRMQQAVTERTNLYEQAIFQLRTQVWLIILVGTAFALFTTRLIRYLSGVKSTPLAISVQLVLYSVIIASLLLRNSRYTPHLQTIYLACIHLVTPIVVIFYGGTQGFGDITLFCTLIVSAVYGWRRWMTVTFLLSTAALIYTLYLEVIGMPIAPFLEERARFASVKLLIFITLVSFITWIGFRFYNQLLQQHQLLADEQLRLTAELRQSNQKLTHLSADIAQSRSKIVTTQEEERRRLRHDLQDRVGPTLASLNYRSGAARNAIRRQPEQAKPLLDALENNIKETLTDVRQFVYALHPPLLDQLGLASAIQQHINGLQLPFSAEFNAEDLPEETSAATDVVVYQLVHTVFACTKNQLQGVQIYLYAEDGMLQMEMLLEGSVSAEFLTIHPDMLDKFERIEEVTGVIDMTQVKQDHVRIFVDLPL